MTTSRCKERTSLGAAHAAPLSRVLQLLLAGWLAGAGAPAAAAGSTPATRLFVSPEGSDAWSGTREAPDATKSDGPFATLRRARDAVRALKKAGPLKAPVKVIVRGGTYFLDETLVLEPRDSGTKECPVSYEAYPGEKPVLSGGRRIEGPWKPYQGKILVTTIDDVRQGKWYFRQLSVNGKRQERSRRPDDGYYFRKEALGPTSFHYADDNMRRWKDLEDVEVVVFHSWNESRFRIADLDEKEKIVRFRDPKARHPIGWGGAGGPNRYYIENALEEITRPGEWYLQRRTGRLYYWPTGDIAQARVVAPVLKQLLRFEGDVKKSRYVEHVSFRRFTFSDSDWPLPANGYPDCGDVGDIVEPSAITYEAARYCTFEHNRVRNVGTYAIELTGDGNRIADNEILEAGSGGIITRSYGKERNVIAYNHIHRCGLVYPSAVGINIDDGGGTIEHNLIHDISHSGVYARHWASATQPKERRNQEQGLVIAHNEIHHVMTNIHDGAGIFVRDSNIVIDNNLIHDVYARGDRCPGWGIYLGCETRDTIVKNNVVYDTTETVHVWYNDRNITMENNIFVGPHKSQINYQNPQHLRHENIKFLRNVVFCTQKSGYLFNVSGERSLPVQSDSNVIFSAIGCVLNDPVIRGVRGIQSLTDWRKRGLDNKTITADPLFVDLEKRDLRLKKGSPAFKVGFKPIDLSHVGLRGRR